jgi:hypothetical protein
MGEARCIEEFRNEIRMMNCMKMYGLDITQEEYLRVRDHISRGAPFMFKNHNSKETNIEDVQWKVAKGNGGDGIE